MSTQATIGMARVAEQSKELDKERREWKLWEFSTRELVDTEWISNKVLLYSTENYIQYPMINHNGKEY